MKRFTILKNNFDDTTLILDLFKGFVGQRIQVEYMESIIVLFYEYNDLDEIHSFILSMSTELMKDVTAYTSCYENKKMDLEYDIVKEWINDLKPGSYDFKKALLSNICPKNSRELLKFILDGSGVDEEFIRKFAENDLNVSKASKEMYIHRNTLNYKLDRLKEVSGFDLRSFQDAYIIYQQIIIK